MKNNKFLKSIFSMVFFTLCFLPFNSMATDGYFSLGYGSWNKGAAGVGVGYYHYSLIGGNPAGNVWLGTKYNIGVSVFSPNRQYTVSGNPSGMPGTFGLVPGTIESDSKVFIIPSAGANWVFGEKNAFAVALYGNGGMNTDYPTQTFHDQSSTTTGVNMGQFFAGFTYSRQLTEKHSLGLTGIASYQYFEANGLSNFGGFSSDATKLTNNGSDNAMGFGFKVGYMGEIVDHLFLGATYQSKIYMSEFDEYAGLFAEGGDFDVPATWTAGLAFEATDALTLMFDVKQIFYSGINSVGNPMDLQKNSPTDPLGNPNPNFSPLGSDNGWGFGWEDMTIFKFGAEYTVEDAWILRGGYSYGNNPVQESEVLFNILAPGVIQNHVALGFSKLIGNGKSIDFSFNYAFSNTVKGWNPLDFDPEQVQQGNFVPNQEIELKMSQFDVEVGFTF
ncbi:MAG: outer membrane protein transport protein [Bacteroidetes bacterium]|nr:outer membrane protein transport protein [Bacteroidota bacterium]